MSDFEKAISVILKHEGGFINHPDDPGGATNYGISLRFLKSINYDLNDLDIKEFKDASDIKEMTLGQAKDIYRKYFWEPNKYQEINDQPLATKVFDMAVLMGPPKANLLLQKCCNKNWHEPLTEDGKIGESSIKVINAICVLKANSLLEEFRKACANYYDSIVKNKPKLQVFLKGWLRRAYS